MTWQLIPIISLSVFAGLLFLRIIIVVITSKRSNKGLDNKRELIKDITLYEKTAKSPSFYKGVSNSTIYKTARELNVEVPKYIISDDTKEKSLVINYGDNRSTSQLIVYVYNDKEKLISIIYVNDAINVRYSDIIELPKQAKYINITLPSLGARLNKTPNRAVPILLSILDTFVVLPGLIAVAYFAISITGGAIYPNYLIDKGFIISMILIIFSIFIYFFFSKAYYKKKYKSLGEV